MDNRALILSAILSAGSLMNCGAPSDDSSTCQDAVAYLRDCNVEGAFEAPETCDGVADEAAQNILSQSCDALMANHAKQDGLWGSFFGLFQARKQPNPSSNAIPLDKSLTEGANPQRPYTTCSTFKTCRITTVQRTGWRGQSQTSSSDYTNKSTCESWRVRCQTQMTYGYTCLVTYFDPCGRVCDGFDLRFPNGDPPHCYTEEDYYNEF